MADYLDDVLGDYSDPWATAAALRRKEQIGTLAQLSGDTQLSPWGEGLQKDVATQRRDDRLYGNKLDLQAQRGGGNNVRGDLQMIREYMNATGASFTDAAEWYRQQGERLSYRIGPTGESFIMGDRTGARGGPLTTTQGVTDALANREKEKSAAKVFGEADAKAEQGAPAAYAKLQAVMINSDEIAKRAAELRDDPSLWRTTGLASYIPSFHGGKAADLEAKIESFKAALFINNIINAKGQGATFGPLSDNEGNNLKYQLASLEKVQSPEAFAEQATRVIEAMARYQKAAKQEFDATYGGYSITPRGAARSGAAPNVPQMSAPPMLPPDAIAAHGQPTAPAKPLQLGTPKRPGGIAWDQF